MAKKNQKGTLIIDIGSASVGAGLVRFEKEGPVLEKVKRQPIGSGSKETRDNLEREMLVALDELLKTYEGSHADVRMVLGSPWESATIRTIKAKGEKPATISLKSIERLIETYKNEKPPAAGSIDIEAAAMQIRVNNYPTSLTSPVSGVETAVNLYESEMPETLYKAMLEKVETHVHPSKVAFYTFPLIASAALRSVTDETSFIFIDIGGEVTELGIMHGDALHFLASIPSGYWTILRAFPSSGGDEKKDGVSVGDARSRLVLWARGELSEEENGAIEGRLKTAFAPWLTEFESTLKEASALVPTPRTVFLISDLDPAPWIQKGIRLSGVLNLDPIIITTASVQRFIEMGEGGAFDVALSLEAIFFHIGGDTVVGEPTPSRMV